MRRSPGFAVTAVLTLALGIAANVIVFGVLQAMILRTLDVPHGGAGDDAVAHHVGLSVHRLSGSARCARWQYGIFRRCRYNIQNFGLEANGVTRPVWGYEVSGQYFEVVGIKPFLGRLLRARR